MLKGFKSIARTANAAHRSRTYLKRLDEFDYGMFYHRFGIVTSHDDYIHRGHHFNRCKQYVKAFGLLAFSIAELLGREITTKEFHNLILLAHFAPLADDLFDQRGISPEMAKKILDDPENVTLSNGEEELFLSFYLPFIRSIPDPATTKYYLEKLSEAQMNDSHAFNKMEDDKADKFLLKGGYSCLVIRSVFNENISPEEENVLMLLGKTTQIMDDVFDAHTDLNEGKQTYITCTSSLRNIEAAYQERMQVIFHSAKHLHYSDNQVNKFISVINLLLTPLFNALSKYERLGIQRLTGDQLEGFTSSELVCDMESGREVFRLLVKANRNMRLLV